MAKKTEQTEQTEKVVTNCVACAKGGVTRKATSRGLCGSHLQSASKLIKQNQEAKKAGKKAPNVDSKGREITWELLESRNLATVPQRRNDVASIFLS